MITVPVEAQATIQDFLLDRVAGVPDDVRDKLKEFTRAGYNAVEASINLAELIYARREELPVELLTIGAEIASMVGGHGFSGMGGADGRGAAIAFTIRAMPGVTAPPPASLAAPEPLAAFVPAQDLEAAPIAQGDGVPALVAPPRPA